ncbi:WD40 repeat-like protein [Auricularia subglabra TFB-10046 SS5]|nr:WD40 repeat-like protein [Auricularia subglabra TFB-10046 SS5]
MGIEHRWDLKSKSHERRADTAYVYESASPDVTFPSHDAPLFAIGPSKTGQVYLHYGPLDGDGEFIIIELRRDRAPWGPLQWGHSASRRVLFAGVSGAYDIESAQELYTLPDIRDHQMIGVDATDLDPTFGKTLAVVTNKGRRTVRRLRLYDVNESAAKHMATVELDIDTRAHRQVTALSYSPDGVLLALAHEDNSVYIYDSRFLPKRGERAQQALARFVHGESAVPDEYSFGVTCIAWAPSRGPLACGTREDGLYSGGADGHVRLWRTGLGATNCHNGSIVASMPAGIGSFSLGDTFASEKMLVVCDNNGKLAIWDRPPGPF